MAEVILEVGADCLLSGAPKALVDVLKAQLTIDNPKYKDALKYGRWVGKKLPAKLMFYEQQGQKILFPRGFANEAVRLARQQCQGAIKLVDRRRLCDEVDLECQATLRDYQQQAVDAVLARQFGILESGTGSGKTVMALAIIAARRQPTLILVHTKELLYQWQERVEQFLARKAALLGDGHADSGPITVAIVNSARKKLADLPQQFGQLVVDECHRVPASLFTDVVTAFDCQYLLGLSATAFRRDGLGRLIHIYLGDLVHRVNPQELADSGAVLRPQLIVHPTSFTFRYRDNYQEMLKALTLDQGRNEQIAMDVIQECAQSSLGILVVSDRVAHCQQLAELVEEGGATVAVLTGRSASEERARTVELVRQGQLQVLVSTVQLIGEGFDCPGLASLFLTTPIKFTGRLLQVVGRILRPAAGKTARVHDYVDSEVSLLARSAASRQQSLGLG